MMSPKKLLLILFAFGVASCSTQEPPTPEILGFYEKTKIEFELCGFKISGIVSDAYFASLMKRAPDLLETMRTGINARKPDTEYVNKPQVIEAVEKETEVCAKDARGRVQSDLQQALTSATSELQKRQIGEYFVQWNLAFEMLKLRPEDFTPLSLMLTTYENHANNALDQSKKAWKILVLETMTLEYFCTKKLPKLRKKDSEYHFISRLSSSFDVLTEDLMSVENGNLRIGMSRCAAMAIWGDPTKIINQVDKSGAFEQWTYGGNKNIYLQNGVVISFSK